ncbi:PAS domain S-box protein [bacterium]|nr:PAS domain S-box protein [bacterium]
MNERSDNEPGTEGNSLYRALAASTALVAVVVSTLAIFGWIFHIGALISVLPGLATMKFNTALGFLLSGTTLWLLLEPATSRRRTIIGYSLATVVFLLALSTALEYRLGWNARIDELFVRDAFTDPTKSPPGRMSFATAQCFVFLSLALITLRLEWRRLRPAEFLALLTSLAGLVGTLGYLYNVHTLYRFLPYSTMALHTSVLFVMLGFGVLCVRPGHGLMATITSENVGGRLARRILPWVIVLAVLAGWLQLRSQDWGYFGTEVGTALLIEVGILILAVVVWATARSLNKLHERLEDRGRLYAVLSRCNQAIVHCSAPQELFDQICRVTVHEGGFAAAWLVSVKPPATAFQQSAKEGIELDLFGDLITGRAGGSAAAGPVGSVLASGDNFISNQILRDPRLLAVRPQLRAAGIGALAAIPILESGVVTGALCVFARLKNRFQKEEVALLEEIAADVAFSLQQMVAQRARAELVAIVDSSADAIVGKDLNSVVTSWNASAERLFGYSADEMVGEPITRLFPADRVSEEAAFIERIKRGERISHYETVRKHKDGHLIDVSVSISPIHDNRGEIVGASKIARDITERIAAARALHEAEERLQAIIQNMSEGLVISDMEGRLIYWNPAALQMHGISREEEWNRLLPEFTNVFELRSTEQELLPLESWPMARILRGESVQDLVVHLRRPRDDWSRVVSYSGKRATDAEGNELAFLIIRDITARVLAEAKVKESFREITNLKSALDEHAIVAITDPAGKINYVNDKFCAISGYTREELIGQDHRIVNSGFHPKEFIRGLWNTIKAGRVWQGEIKNRAKGGGYYWVDTTIVPFSDHEGKIREFVAIRADITELKNAEEALRVHADELLRSNKDLEQFAYIASHDLQEPLRAVAGCLQVLQRRYASKIDERADELIKHSVDGAYRMQSLIEGLLAFSRVGTRGKQFGPVDTNTALQNALRNLETAIAETHAVITQDPLPSVKGDPTQLILLFQNLIGNALKFHGEKPPAVHVSARRDGGDWVFAVRDKGIGMDRAHFERVFVIFQRLHTRREYPGTGIGLAICRKIVERHGGRIWVESEPGDGCTFLWTMPAGPADIDNTRATSGSLTVDNNG